MDIKGITVAAIIVFLCAGFVVSNRMSYQDGLDDQAFRCRMIAEKTWPDVDGYFEMVCNGATK
ncbi:hypothetical protein D3C85_972620 [compost metagenome]